MFYRIHCWTGILLVALMAACGGGSGNGDQDGSEDVAGDPDTAVDGDVQPDSLPDGLPDTPADTTPDIPEDVEREDGPPIEGIFEPHRIIDWDPGVRGGIPLAQTQMEVILRIIRAWIPEVGLFVDLGCGDGVLGRQLLNQWPKSKGIFIDFSEPMIEAAKEKCKAYEDRCLIMSQDYSLEDWVESINNQLPVDVVISGYSIHHQEDELKYRIYNDIFNILRPGGVFLNLEHVASPNPEIERFFDDMFVDGLYAYHLDKGGTQSRQDIADKFYNREDKVLNKLTLVEKQVEWLREIGYENTDCFFKLFELALFGGQKPA